MKHTKKKRISPYAELSQKYASTFNQMQKAEDRCRVLGHELEDYKKEAADWENAYRGLKNAIGEYMAMMASDYGVDAMRAKELEKRMFSEPADYRAYPTFSIGDLNGLTK